MSFRRETQSIEIDPRERYPLKCAGTHAVGFVSCGVCNLAWHPDKDAPRWCGHRKVIGLDWYRREFHRRRLLRELRENGQ